MLVNRPSTESNDATRINFALGLVNMTIDTPWSERRVLDLASRTGAFSIAFAEEGAHVVAIEGRAENINAMPTELPSTLHVICADVREVGLHMGKFDVVLCLGILYHLNVEDATELLRKLGLMTRLLIIDTHVSESGSETATNSRGETYEGHLYRDETATSWGSLGTTDSWWFTENALGRALSTASFSSISVYQPQLYENQPSDRAWVVATR